MDYNWTANDGITVRFLEGVGGCKTANGSASVVLYNRQFSVGDGAAQPAPSS